MMKKISGLIVRLKLGGDEGSPRARQDLRTALGIVLVFALGTTALYLRTSADAATNPARPLPVAVASVTFEMSYSVEQRFAGRVEAQNKIPVAFERPGLITNIFVEEGQRVIAGQEIATMDTEALQARRVQLSADRSRTLAQLELARLTKDRQQALSKEGYASVQRFDDARLSATALEASVAAIDSSIRQIDIDLEKSILTTPFDGIVGQQFIDSGTVVNAGMAVVDLFETSNTQARIGLPPEVAMSLAVGNVYPMFYRDRTLSAELIAARSDLDQRTQTVAVLFQFKDNTNLPFGEVVHFLHRKDVSAEGTWLPLSALVEGEKGLWSVYVIAQDGDEARVSRESVEIIHVEDGEAYVRGTLQSDTQVLTGGTNRVAPGQRVAIAS